MALSVKLQTIFDQLLPGEDVWDLCCDHGYLGKAALYSERFKNIYFVDRVFHIIHPLQTELHSGKHASRAHFRACEAEVLEESLTGTVVIAGVGAHTAFNILQTLWQKNKLHARRLILCPQRDQQKFLEWMSDFDKEFSHRYQLRSEQEVAERRRPLWVYVCGE